MFSKRHLPACPGQQRLCNPYASAPALPQSMHPGRAGFIDGSNARHQPQARPARSPAPSPPRSAPNPRRPWPPSRCSTKARPCRSSRAIARKSPAGSTTPSCATSKTRLAYLRELEDRRAAVLASIAEQGKLSDELRGEIEAPTASRGSRTCTCRTSPSAAPRRRSRARPGWSRSPTGCWPIRSLTPEDLRRRLRRRRQGRGRRQGRARRRARDPDGALGRGCRAGRRAARLAAATSA